MNIHLFVDWTFERFDQHIYTYIYLWMTRWGPTGNGELYVYIPDQKHTFEIKCMNLTIKNG